MEYTFEQIVEIEPRLKKVKPIEVSLRTCDIEGFRSAYWNDYARVKKEISELVGDYAWEAKLRTKEAYDTVIFRYIDNGSDEYYKLKAQNFFPPKETY